MTRRLADLTPEQAARQRAVSGEYNRRWREANPEYHREWGAAHRDDRNERNRTYRLTHPRPKQELTPAQREARRESGRKWRLRNAERVSDYMRAYRPAYRAANRERIAAKKRADYAADPKRTIERSRRWAIEQPTRRRAIAAASAANRRADAAGVQGRISHEDVIALWRRQPACQGCGDGLGLDHVIPLSAGGPNTSGNLQNLCPPCNSRKGAVVPR